MLFNVVISMLQIVLQVVAAFFAYKIGKFTNIDRYWYLIVLAFLLMAIRKVTAIFITLNILPGLEGTIGIVDSVYLPLFISLSLTIGIYSLFRRLKNE